MTWLNLLFVVYLSGALSPIIAQNVTSQIEEHETPTTSRIQTSRGLFAETALQVKDSLMNLVSEVSDSIILARRNKPEEPCVGAECTASLNFSEDRGQADSQGKVKLTEGDKRQMSEEADDDYGVPDGYDGPDGGPEKAPSKKRPGRNKGKGKPEKKPYHYSAGIPLKKSSLGVAVINSYNDGSLCTGVHLTPWILVSVANCLFGRDLEDLFVTVTLQLDDGSLEQVSADVESVTCAPEQRRQAESRIAVVRIYGDIGWNVRHFELPRIDTSAANVVYKRLKTYTNEWSLNVEEDYYASYVPASVHLNYFVCRSFPIRKDWYCVESKGLHDVFKQIDIGGPFFYKTGQIKRLLGIYTGDNENKTGRGHLFQSLEPHQEWLDEYVYAHPLPPDYLSSPSYRKV